MSLSRAALSDWYWAGGSGRRLLVSVLVTLLVVLVPSFSKDAAISIPLVALFVGWDLGAWSMDKAYVHRMSRRPPGDK